MKKINYFYYQGRRIFKGTILKIKPTQSKYGIVEEGTFISWMPDNNMYCICIDTDGSTRTFRKNEFFNLLLDVTEKQDNRFIINVNNISLPQKTIRDKLQDDALLLAWIWYLFLMFILLFINGGIIVQLIITFIFFDYRSDKLQ